VNGAARTLLVPIVTGSNMSRAVLALCSFRSTKRIYRSCGGRQPVDGDQIPSQEKAPVKSTEAFR
jgi:hypothetical protein